MRILFVHQNFPGQYQHLLEALSRIGGHTLVGLGIEEPSQAMAEGVTSLRYQLSRGNTAGIHPWALEFESKVIRGEACAAAAFELKQQGFTPDLLCAHPGWGEALFLKQIWPDCPLLCYQEFFYQNHGFDLGFDPELQGLSDWRSNARTQVKNAYLLLTLQAADWNVTPTHFQHSSFPPEWRQRISTIHDGIDTQRASPDSDPPSLTLPDGTELKAGDPIVTFVNRRLEPYRGCHSFLRSLPALQRQVPEARVVIVGETRGVSYGAACKSGEWKDVFLAEIEGRYDPSSVHFTGPLPYATFLQLLRLSACHVYLTYPFVLSWSLLEAMSCGCPVVGSATAPVEEVIVDGHNGVLVDFFSPSDIAAAVADLLRHRQRAHGLGERARETVLGRYSLERCVPRQLALMDLVAARAIGG
ncbi:glycosyltransferase family 4 protein [Cyanobium sp. FGCU-6]|jgi:glycosyltransferase involved in cell wall biosynthesis|nr:glycosyltransferase family 4 protein [Cyanobium sp. FGCU6]